MSIQEIIEYVVRTPGNSNPAVLKDMLEQLEGGGSGDFSIATLTLTVTGENDDDTADVIGTILYQNTLISTLDCNKGTHQIQIVMYKNEAQCHVVGKTNYPNEISGDATIVEDVVVITGDCAASIEGKQAK